MNSRYLDDCLSRQLIFFTGKGGVGKSTITWATALLLQRAGKRVLVTSWSPFDQGKTESGGTPAGIEYLYLEPMACFREYVLLTLKFETLYDIVFENKVLKTFVSSSPGLSDTVIAGKLENLILTGKYDHVLVDLPSTGHTLSFFQSPAGVKKIFAIGTVHKDTVRICDFFQSPKCRLDFVSIPEDLSLTENLELKEKLDKSFPLNYGFLHLNMLTPKFDLPPPESFPEGSRIPREQYARRQLHEAEGRTFAEQFNLPILESNRLALGNSSDIAAEVANGLERS